MVAPLESALSFPFSFSSPFLLLLRCRYRHSSCSCAIATRSPTVKVCFFFLASFRIMYSSIGYEGFDRKGFDACSAELGHEKLAKLHGKTTALGSTVQQANGIVTVAPKPSSSTDDVRETKHVGFSRRASGERRTNSARTS
ncbi:acid protease [Sesbania bispinosa]|nr:acid protease [Sesbania bispinosa]